jgi:hypothetical protein
MYTVVKLSVAQFSISLSPNFRTSHLFLVFNFRLTGPQLGGGGLGGGRDRDLRRDWRCRDAITTVAELGSVVVAGIVGGIEMVTIEFVGCLVIS